MFIPPGSIVAAGVVRAVCAERGPVQHAAAHRAPAGGRGSARLAHGRGQGGGLHGPHQDLPGAGREAQGAPRRRC